MNSDETERAAETYFEGSLQSFVTPTIPVVPGLPLEPRRGRPGDPRPEQASNTENGLAPMTPALSPDKPVQPGKKGESTDLLRFLDNAAGRTRYEPAADSKSFALTLITATSVLSSAPINLPSNSRPSLVRTLILSALSMT